MTETLLDRVKQILTDKISARDSDPLLGKEIIRTYGINPDTASYGYICQLQQAGELPSHESIRRCRQKLQEHNPGLRGSQYGKRKQAGEDVSDLVNRDFEQATMIF